MGLCDINAMGECSFLVELGITSEGGTGQKNVVTTTPKHDAINLAL